MSGGTPSRDRPEFFQDGTIPWVKSGELAQGVVTVTAERITPLALEESAAKIVPSGAILIAMYGATVGQIAMLGIDAATNQAVCAVKCDEALCLPRFLYYSLKRRTPELLSLRVGGAQPNISQKLIRELVVELPNLSEQVRIVELLDQAAALRQQRAGANIELARLLPTLFRHHFRDPLENGCDFDRKPLGALLSGIDSGISPRCLDRPAHADEWAVLKLGAVTWCRFDDTQNKALPSDVAPDPSIEVHASDLLFSRKNTLELVGATALVRKVRPRLLLPDLIFRLQPKPDAPVIKEYLWVLLMQDGMRNRLRAIASGAAGSMPNISKARLETIEVPLPPIENQQTFARQVHTILDLESQAAASAGKLETLFQTLLHRAFTGELTARWRAAHVRNGLEEMRRLSD